MNEQLYIQTKDKFAVVNLNFHNIGAGGVDCYGGMNTAYIRQLSNKRFIQYSMRCLKASGERK